MKERTLPFVEVTQGLIGQAYELGVVDCFSIVLQYFDSLGVKIPDVYQGQTRKTYAVLFKKEPEVAKELMIRFMEDNFEEIHPGKAFCGDVMLLSLPESDSLPFLAINGGNGNIIAASESRGVSVTPLKHYNILKVYRCPRESRS